MIQLLIDSDYMFLINLPQKMVTIPKCYKFYSTVIIL